jgi:hypothetical protein
MAKKKPAKPTPRKRPPKAEPKATKPAPPLVDTAELAADARNPRKIKEDAARGLGNSLQRFGDLSGIVWNKRTGELVAGHQRMQQIRNEWGDRPIELVDQANQLYGIRIDADHFFAVRVVNWSVAVQRAANVAANNQKIAGAFTDDVTAFLLEVEADLAAEAPGLVDDVLLTELLAAELDVAASGEGAVISESYQIVVQCSDEAHQRRVYEQLSGEGLVCKVLTL